MKGRNIVLLTATIQPKTVQHQLALTNASERLLDYTRALEFYSSKIRVGGIDKVIFVDNSGYDLNELSAKFHNEHIEFISFYDLDYPSHFHRGYGEFRLIDYAHKNSSVLKELNNNDRVWKITGRYVIKNILNFIRFSPRKFDLYINDNSKKKWINMEIMAWNPKGFKHVIQDVWKNFSGSLPPELMLCKIINDLDKNEIKFVKKYFYPPLIYGRRGSDGSSFLGRLGYIRYAINLVKKGIYLPIRFLCDK